MKNLVEEKYEILSDDFESINRLYEITAQITKYGQTNDDQDNILFHLRNKKLEEVPEQERKMTFIKITLFKPAEDLAGMNVFASEMFSEPDHCCPHVRYAEKVGNSDM